jgi:hypothetical protein
VRKRQQWGGEVSHSGGAGSASAMDMTRISSSPPPPTSKQMFRPPTYIGNDEEVF